MAALSFSIADAAAAVAHKPAAAVVAVPLLEAEAATAVVGIVVRGGH